MNGSLVELDREVAAAYFDRKPFHLRHRLAGHPSFSLPRLMELALEAVELYIWDRAGSDN